MVTPGAGASPHGADPLFFDRANVLTSRYGVIVTIDTRLPQEHDAARGETREGGGPRGRERGEGHDEANRLDALDDQRGGGIACARHHWHRRDRTDARGGDEVGADVAALHDLQAGFHAAISGGGHIDDLMALWADDSTFTVGGTTLHGKDEIRAFFLTSGGFTHNWVSLSPSFKTRIDVHGDWADLIRMPLR